METKASWLVDCIKKKCIFNNKKIKMLLFSWPGLHGAAWVEKYRENILKAPEKTHT